MEQKIFFENLPAINLNNFPVYKITDLISKYLENIKPEIVLIPSINDIHDDHKIIFKSAKVSLRPNKISSIKKSCLTKFCLKLNGMRKENYLIQIIL